jgi:hypothetical protein
MLIYFSLVLYEREKKSLTKVYPTNLSFLSAIFILVIRRRLFRKKGQDPGNPCGRGRLCTVHLLIKIGCFVKEEKYCFFLKKKPI